MPTLGMTQSFAPLSLSLLRLNLSPEPLFLLAKLGREFGAEVLGFGNRADFDLGVLERGALEPFDRLFQGLHLPDPEAGDQLLRLGERPIDDRRLLSRELHPGAV